MSGDQFFGPPLSIIFLNAGSWNLGLAMSLLVGPETEVFASGGGGSFDSHPGRRQARVITPAVARRRHFKVGSRHGTARIQSGCEPSGRKVDPRGETRAGASQLIGVGA